jgi:aspartate carbamoyltransferase catalytic subunit
MHEHPTQGLLDLYSIREKRRIEGLTVAIVGDIAHSRVARSAIWGLTKLGAQVRIYCPPPFLPAEAGRMGVELMSGIEACLKDADVVMMLRIQHERQKVLDAPDIQEYRRFYSLTRDRLRLAKSNAILMHPGPVNRGVELPPKLADSDQSIILRQVTNGIAVRMAVLYVLLTRGA